MTSSSKTPSDWRAFLRDSNNKTELFNYLADKISQMPSTNVIIVTNGEDAVSNHPMDTSGIAPCSHEEADTRMFVHARQAVEEGCQNVIVKANDTDVLVIAISVLPTLQGIGLQHLWLAFGQGRSLRWIPVHELLPSIGQQKSSGLLFFHAFTGCDVVSAFRGRGKKTAWQTWGVCDEVSAVFNKLSQYPLSVQDIDMKVLEQFVVMMYDRSSTADGVDSARLEMFARKQRPYEAIPPTRAALLQHVKRASYQAGCVWGQTLLRQPESQNPADWGWIRNGDQWRILWSDLPPIAESCKQLTKCGCQSECRGRCKCYRFGLDCTAMCSCRC